MTYTEQLAERVISVPVTACDGPGCTRTTPHAWPVVVGWYVVEAPTPGEMDPDTTLHFCSRRCLARWANTPQVGVAGDMGEQVAG